MDLLANRYRLEAEIGRGEMAAVHRAHDTGLGQPVVAKTLFGSTLGGQAHRKRLVGEQAGDGSCRSRSVRRGGGLPAGPAHHSFPRALSPREAGESR